MPKLTIDGKPVEAEPGATILQAARSVGIEIPTLCYADGREPLTSCFVCVVRVEGKENLVPACATKAEDGMVVDASSEEVREARRVALELLLSDHLGDCIAPCQAACPAGMNIPLMIRQIARGEFRQAVATVRRRIALPAVLGRICPAPCERACRRGQHDAPVAICLLKRFAADTDLARDEPTLPQKKEPSGKRVAVVGAGPAGLAAAWHLVILGHEPTIFEANDRAGGTLRSALSPERLPPEVLDSEIALVERMGARLVTGRRIENATELLADFDAVVVAVGGVIDDESAALGLPLAREGIEADRRSLATPIAGIFAAGSAVRPKRMAVRSVAEGRVAAVSVDQFLKGQEPTGPEREFSVHMGRLSDAEMQRLVALADGRSRVEPAGDGFVEAEARAEAARCLHCDCRKPVSCKLRRYAAAYGAKPTRYKDERRSLELWTDHPEVIYEPGKCIRCGLCVQIASQAGEQLGMAFLGRGYEVVIAPPFSRPLSEGLRRVAAECAAACPTGALALRSSEEHQS